MSAQYNTFWAWGIGAQANLEHELSQARDAYQRRFGREPAALFVHPSRAAAASGALEVFTDARIAVNALCFVVERPGDERAPWAAKEYKESVL